MSPLEQIVALTIEFETRAFEVTELASTHFVDDTRPVECRRCVTAPQARRRIDPQIRSAAVLVAASTGVGCNPLVHEAVPRSSDVVVQNLLLLYAGAVLLNVIVSSVLYY